MAKLGNLFYTSTIIIFLLRSRESLLPLLEIIALFMHSTHSTVVQCSSKPYKVSLHIMIVNDKYADDYYSYAKWAIMNQHLIIIIIFVWAFCHIYDLLGRVFTTDYCVHTSTYVVPIKFYPMENYSR